MMARAYLPWSEHDLEALLIGLASGLTIATLTELLGRSPGAIRFRLALLHDTGIIEITRTEGG